MKILTLAFMLSTTTFTSAFAAFDCTELKNKDEMMACLKDLRLLENKYAVKDACAGVNKPKTQDEYKLCVAMETKKDPCYGYKKYGTQEGSQYDQCFAGKEATISDARREAKTIDKPTSTPTRSPAFTSDR